MIFRPKRIGKATGSNVASEIYKLATARGKVTNKKIPAKDVIILRSMYVPGSPITYRVAYTLKLLKNTWEIADVSEDDLIPSTRSLVLDVQPTGDV